MSKFKVGDRVRIVVSNDSMVTSEMNNCVGLIAEVSRVDCSDHYVYKLRSTSESNDFYYRLVNYCAWPEDSLELATEPDKQLGIISVQDWVRIYTELTESSPCNALFKDQPMLSMAFFMVSTKLHQKLIKEGYIREK